MSRMNSPQVRARRMGMVLVFLLFLSACSMGNAGTQRAPANTTNAADKLKLLVSDDAVYRINVRELMAAGLDVPEPLTHEVISLSDGPDPVPFLIEDDALVFYGRASHSPYFAERPYVLEANQAGQEMTQTALPIGDDNPLPAVTQSLRLEENHNYASEARHEEGDDVWFWSKLAQQNTFSAEFVLPAVAEGPATLRFNAWGVTHDHQVENDHDVEIRINDTPVGPAVWDGQTHHTAQLTIPSGLLREGLNTITVDNRPEGAAFLDIMQINWFELDYPAPPQAEGDRIYFTSAAGDLTVGGLGEPPLVLDISDPVAPRELTGWLVADGKLRMAATEGARLAAIGPQGFSTPRVEPVREGRWLDQEQQADLIVIAAEGLVSALDPLVAAREAEGLSVAVVPVEEIYDGFGYGAPEPESIRNFISYAYQNWQAPQPRYLLLVGDATSDYLGNLNPVADNLVPSPMVPVHFSGETVSDSRMADADGDMRPDLAVGRWPARSPQEVSDLIKRTLGYEQSTANERVVFATDGSETVFSKIAKDLAAEANLPAGQIEQRDGPTPDEIGELWRDGAWLATYIGHGSIDRWGKENIFSLDELSNMSSESLPIVLQLTCLTGLFSHPEQTSLAEAMLLHPEGPVEIVAASSLTLSTHQEPFAVELLKQLQEPSIERVGDAFLGAKRSLRIEESDALREISDTFALFGDPSARIARP